MGIEDVVGKNANDNNPVRSIEAPPHLTFEQATEFYIGLAERMVPQFRQLIAKTAEDLREAGEVERAESNMSLALGMSDMVENLRRAYLEYQDDPEGHEAYNKTFVAMNELKDALADMLSKMYYLQTFFHE